MKDPKIISTVWSYDPIFYFFWTVKSLISFRFDNLNWKKKYDHSFLNNSRCLCSIFIFLIGAAHGWGSPQRAIQLVSEKYSSWIIQYTESHCSSSNKFPVNGISSIWPLSSGEMFMQTLSLRHFFLQIKMHVISVTFGTRHQSDVNWSWWGSICWMWSTFTCFDDVAQLIEQEFVVSSSVQTLLHVAVEFVHHALHICVLVLLDARHTEIATPQPCRKYWDWISKFSKCYDKGKTWQRPALCTVLYSNVTAAACY